jgi:hypothetical protein
VPLKNSYYGCRKGLIVKRLLALIAITLIFTSGCSTAVDTDYSIKVAGSTGTQFSGSYIVTDANGESTTYSVDGTVPAEYSVTGIKIECTFQKLVEAGELRLEILRDGEMVASAETSSGMGVISALTQ